LPEFLVSLICHAERSSYPEEQKYEWTEWVPNLLSLLDRIEKDTGFHIPITWCCCANHSRQYVDSGKILVAQQFPDVWKRIRDRGDEIGLHIHYAPEIGDKRFKFFSHEFQHLLLKEDVERLTDFGFDPPKTYTPGNQVWRKEWASFLLDAGFEVDSTIMALPSKYLVWPNLLENVFEVDISPYLLWTHRKETYPFRLYRTHDSDLTQEGKSELVELPVIGWLGCDIYPERPYFKNSPPFDHLDRIQNLEPKNWMVGRFLRFEKEQGKPFPGLFTRWESRAEVDVDIWPTLFHPRELDAINIQMIGKFIRSLLEWEDVSFATAYDAVKKWKRSN